MTTTLVTVILGMRESTNMTKTQEYAIELLGMISKDTDLSVCYCSGDDSFCLWYDYEGYQDNLIIEDLSDEEAEEKYKRCKAVIESRKRNLKLSRNQELAVKLMTAIENNGMCNEVIYDSAKDLTTFAHRYCVYGQYEAICIFDYFSNEQAEKEYQKCLLVKNKKAKYKKYELTDETIVVDNKTLHRIKALKSFVNSYATVEVGDLGGYVESESNLSHDGSSWIYDLGMAIDEAFVCDDGVVANNSLIREHATIKENGYVLDGIVQGHAVIQRDGVVTNNSVITDDAVIEDIVEWANIGQRAYIKSFRDYIKFEHIGDNDCELTFYKTIDQDIMVNFENFKGYVYDFTKEVLHHKRYAELNRAIDFAVVYLG